MKNTILAVLRMLVIGALVMPVVSCEKENEEIINNIMEGRHPRPVDLGLSVKWVSCNLGAYSPEGYGNYYSWGEIGKKNDYSRENYKWDDINIGSEISGTKYDVVHQEKGGGWRMPTLYEIQELINNCDWSWNSVNGVEGFIVTGPNGNSIFLPNAGFYQSDFLITNRGGGYWSATSDDPSLTFAYCMEYGDGGDVYDWGIDPRNCGLPVRPVTE